MTLCRKCNQNPVGPDGGMLESFAFLEEVCAECVERAVANQLIESDPTDEPYSARDAFEGDWRNP